VESYQQPPGVPALVSRLTRSDAGLGDIGGFLRRLMPFEGAEALSGPAVGAVPEAITAQAASIVSQAASILDEEMARGVLAAATRSVAGGSRQPGDAVNPVLRQVHELVDRLAAMWPAGQSVPAFHVPRPASGGGEVDPPSEVRPRTTVRPGQRATISMALRNSEGRAVRLVPAATDLLGSRGGRIAAALLECTPPDVQLEPNESRDIVIAATVPADAAPGCYSGLLVVTGVDYLRALITIDVV